MARFYSFFRPNTIFLFLLVLSAPHFLVPLSSRISTNDRDNQLICSLLLCGICKTWLCFTKGLFTHHSRGGASKNDDIIYEQPLLGLFGQPIIYLHKKDYWCLLPREIIGWCCVTQLVCLVYNLKRWPWKNCQNRETHSSLKTWRRKKLPDPTTCVIFCLNLSSF